MRNKTRIPTEELSSEPNFSSEVLVDLSFGREDLSFSHAPAVMARAATMKDPIRRRLFLSSRVVLAKRLSEWGSVEQAQIKFSLSHSDPVIAIAWSKDAVGVDVERTREVLHMERILRRMATRSEGDGVLALAKGERDSSFIRLWTRKEAALKALGLRVIGDLRGVDCSSDRVRIDGRDVCFESREVFPGFWLSVARVGEAFRLRLRRNS